MRKTLCATALVTIALLGAGCKKSDPLVGKWSGTLPSQGGAAANATATWEFKADKSLSISSESTTPIGKVSSTITGDYSVEGENITINFKDLKATGVPKEAQPFIEMAKKQLTAKPIKATYKVVSDDQITFSGEGGKASQTLTRVKEGS